MYEGSVLSLQLIIWPERRFFLTAQFLVCREKFVCQSAYYSRWSWLLWVLHIFLYQILKLKKSFWLHHQLLCISSKQSLCYFSYLFCIAPLLFCVCKVSGVMVNGKQNILLLLILSSVGFLGEAWRSYTVGMLSTVKSLATYLFMFNISMDMVCGLWSSDLWLWGNIGKSLTTKLANQ